MTDLWSWAMYRFSRWRSAHPGAGTTAALAIVALLAAILLWRLFIREPLAARRTRKSPVAARRDHPGSDSPFYRIEALLARAGSARAPHEPLGAWLARLGREREDIAVAPLQALLHLHYRYRFDPDGLSAAEQRALSEEVERWLQTCAHEVTRTAGLPVR
jgi:hypothetical protein